MKIASIKWYSQYRHRKNFVILPVLLTVGCALCFGLQKSL